MNLNLKMTVERSKRRSQFLSLVFITKCFNKNLLLRKLIFSTIFLLQNRLANRFYSAPKRLHSLLATSCTTSTDEDIVIKISWHNKRKMRETYSQTNILKSLVHFN